MKKVVEIIKKRMPIGINDYKEVVDGYYYLIDKTLLIKELIDRGSKVFLFPRPRRFGKSLNMSMLQCFFEHPISRPHNIKAEPLAYLFHDKQVWQHESIRILQGTKPVISLTFKDIKPRSWDECYEKLVNAIAEEYASHSYLLDGLLMSNVQKSAFNKIVNKTASKTDYEHSLKNLSEYLQRHYQVKVTVLIDEYDAPIHAGYLNNFYTDVVNFLRNMFSAVFKDNSALDRGIITGILRTAKEGIFSGLNNLVVFSLLNEPFADKFGFTEQEVTTMLATYEMAQHGDAVHEWYDGYITRKIDPTTKQPVNLYNPWSLINFVDSNVDNNAEFNTYWGNTSDHSLIKKMLTSVSANTLNELKLMLSNKISKQTIDEGMIFPGMERNATAIWSLLLFSGYLTSVKTIVLGTWSCELKIPNREIHCLFEKLMQEICAFGGNENFETMLQALINGDVEIFSELFITFFVSMMSLYDIPDNEAERGYHLFVLGILTPLATTYEIRSNRESGSGRYDILLSPLDQANQGVIIEFKKIKIELTPMGNRKKLTPKKQAEALSTAANLALTQIREKNYATELRARGVKNILAYGIAIDGKNVLIKAETL